MFQQFARRDIIRVGVLHHPGTEAFLGRNERKRVKHEDLRIAVLRGLNGLKPWAGRCAESVTHGLAPTVDGIRHAPSRGVSVGCAIQDPG
jgi:hypothetical protein